MFKIRSGLFKRAAEKIDGGRSTYSCNALSFACRDSYGFIAKGRDHPKICLITEVYAWLISPVESSPVKIRDFEYAGEGDFLLPSMAKEHRVIALLMVGEAWKDL